MAVYGGGGRMDMPPRVRFDAIGEAWKMVQSNLGVWVPTMLAYIGTILVVSFIGGFIGGMMTGGGRNGPSPAFGLVQIVLAVINIGVSSLMLGGLYRMALKQVRGQPIQVGDLFSATDIVGSMFITQLLYVIGVGIGELFCVLPGLLVATMWSLAFPLVVDQGVSPTDALSRSWNALKGDMWSALGVMLVAGILASLGFLLCGVGGLVTAPISFLTIAIIYRDFFDPGAGMGGGMEPPSQYPGQYPPPGNYPPGR